VDGDKAGTVRGGAALVLHERRRRAAGVTEAGAYNAEIRGEG